MSLGISSENKFFSQAPLIRLALGKQCLWESLEFCVCFLGLDTWEERAWKFWLFSWPQRFWCSSADRRHRSVIWLSNRLWRVLVQVPTLVFRGDLFSCVQEMREGFWLFVSVWRDNNFVSSLRLGTFNIHMTLNGSNLRHCEPFANLVDIQRGDQEKGLWQGAPSQC